MAKPMYNAREAASGDTVTAIKELYKETLPRIQKYQGEIWAAQKKNARVISRGEKILDAFFHFSLIVVSGALSYYFFYAISNIKDSFALSMNILAILIGGPVVILTALIRYLVAKPDDKEIFVKFPLKKEEKKFQDLIKQFGSEQGCGTELVTYVETVPTKIGLKEPLPKNVMFRGRNEDPSKRSFLFEVDGDEITILLPDEAGVYKYAGKPGNSDGESFPDSSLPRIIGDSAGIIDRSF